MLKDNRSSISDVPFNEAVDDFGIKRYVNGLISFIENSSAPITIALQGEWGSGKTSLMTRLERALCCGEKSQFIGIDINTWEYSMMATPETTVYKILAKLVNDLTKNDSHSKKTLKKFLKGAGNFLYRGARESLKTLPAVGGMLSVGLEAANVPTQIIDETEDAETVSLSDLKKALEQAVQKTITEAGKKGVIVFVDDLDRLNPPVAVEILELLKNIFCIDDCIFVLAIDYDVVVKGLEPKFGKLTDKNEREFRSFFDKIIQVPFSLPVSSYRPMDFVLSSLVKIGYITAVEKGDERFKRPFREIVESSVGKNPRSIKRLINTLSLLSCIAKCGKDKDSEFIDSREGRIVNFAIVSIQVCYPKIYRMLAFMPNFTKWNNTVVARMNLPLISGEEGQNPEWEEVLEAACSTDKYLTQHFNDIRSLLFLIQDTLTESNQGTSETFEDKIRSLIDKSSVTGVSDSPATVEVDQKRLISHMHNNVIRRIQQKRPDLREIRPKKNTGNGGFFITLPDGKEEVEIIIRPKVTPNKIACELLLTTQVKRPNHLVGKKWEELWKDEKINSALTKFDRVISPLLRDTYYFEGRTYPESNLGTYFKSFVEEQAYRSGQGWQDEHVAQNVSYWINLPGESLFEDKAIVDTLADVIIATYDLRNAFK